jgi:4-hydroxybenzoate polyprenyltransferase
MRSKTISLVGSAPAGTELRAPGDSSAQPLLERLWVYQGERFPIFAHGLLIAAFSSSAVAFSWLLRDNERILRPGSFAVALVSSFFFFLQLRVADEFKDFEEDKRWRPYRPVPRGLVRLRELAGLAALGGVAQLGLAISLSWPLCFLLILVWGYLALMTREFFVREWIRERPLTYLWTHMLIIPMADFYATACDWARSGAAPPSGLGWFIVVSFCNGIALEIGRKVRAPDDEEEGVRTYSVLWGRDKAIGAWLLALAGSGACALAAADRIGFFPPVLSVLGMLFIGGAWAAGRFLLEPTTRRARRVEQFSGIWTLVMWSRSLPASGKEAYEFRRLARRSGARSRVRRKSGKFASAARRRSRHSNLVCPARERC